MLKYEETFQVSKGCKLATVVVQILLVFFFLHFSNVIGTKIWLAHPYILYQNESLHNYNL